MSVWTTNPHSPRNAKSVEADSRSPACSRGAKRGLDHLSYPDEALGRSQGGFGTKVHVRADGNGKPMVVLLTAGQRHEQTMFEALMEHGAVKRRVAHDRCVMPVIKWRMILILLSVVPRD